MRCSDRHRRSGTVAVSAALALALIALAGCDGEEDAQTETVEPDGESALVAEAEERIAALEEEIDELRESYRGAAEADERAEAGPADEEAVDDAASPPAEPLTAGELAAAAESGGVVLEAYEIRRSGNTAVLHFGVHAAEEDWNPANKLGGIGSLDVSRVTLIDVDNEQRYLVLEDDDGNCVCSSFLQLVERGERILLSAAFAAPPDDVDRMSVLAPTFPQLDDVPVVPDA